MKKNKRGSSFVKSPGASGVNPTSGGTSGNYGPSRNSSKRKRFSCGY